MCISLPPQPPNSKTLRLHTTTDETCLQPKVTPAVNQHLCSKKSIKNPHTALKMSFSNIMCWYSGIVPFDLEMKCSSISLWCGKENNSMTRRVVERSWVVDVY